MNAVATLLGEPVAQDARGAVYRYDGPAPEFLQPGDRVVGQRADGTVIVRATGLLHREGRQGLLSR